MDQIHVGLEMHFSAIKTIIRAVESLLNQHPYHSQSAKNDFKHAYAGILFSMHGWISEQMDNLDKTTFENGQLCTIIERNDEDDNPPQVGPEKED